MTTKTKQRILTVAVGDVQYSVHDPGGVIGSALETGEPYEAKLLYHIKRRRFQGTAVDAGANIGNHALWFALACGMHVKAFEPIEWQRLAANIKLNDAAAQIDVWPFGLAHHRCWASYDGQGVMNTSEPGPYRMVPLDLLHLKDVALIKADVEGMEPQVLRGAERTIRTQHPVLYMEAADSDAHYAVSCILQPWGYMHKKTFGATPLEEWEWVG